jgi:hypothetical protein
MTIARLSAVLAILSLAVLVLWVSVPTSLLLRPVAYEMRGGMVYATRELPVGSVWARWGDAVTRYGFDGQPVETCRQSGVHLYEQRDGNVARVPAARWFTGCDTAPPGVYEVRSSWCALPFHGVPALSDVALRCAYHTWTFTVLEADPAP